MKMESEVTPVSNDFMATHCVLNSSATEWSAPDRADANDVYSVERFLATPIVQHLFSIVDVVSRCNSASMNLRSTAIQDTAEVILILHRYPYVSEAVALCEMFANPHIRALLTTYDAVVNRAFEPEVPADFPEVDEDENVAVKIVELVKNVPHIGTTLRLGDADEEMGSSAPQSDAGVPARPASRQTSAGPDVCAKRGYAASLLKKDVGNAAKRTVEEKRLYVARVMHGGVADRSKLIEIGDELVEVNGVRAGESDPLQLVRTMNECAGTLRLTLIPPRITGNENVLETPSARATAELAAFSANASVLPAGLRRESVPEMAIESPIGVGDSNGWNGCVFVKALFKYIAEEDTLIPCREAGLSFERGEILRVVDTSDQSWWQAQKLVATTAARTGLIPGRALLEKRERFIRTQPHAQQLLRDASLNYEALVRWRPCQERGDGPRVLVLAGADGIGKRELRAQLIATDAQHFAAPKLFVVRDKSDGDSKRGRLDDDLAFEVSPFEFERLRNEGQLLERGTIQSGTTSARINVTYGLPFGSLDAILAEARVPIVCLRDTSALRTLRNSKYKPFVIFVQPPSLAVLLETRLSNSNFLASDQQLASPHNETEFRELISSSGRIAASYAHLFDACIVNDDLPVALEQLRAIALSVETHEHWLPVDWLTSATVEQLD